MNTDQLTPVVRWWLRQTEATPPDAHRSACQVMARMPYVRQRGRWWPLPVFGRRTSLAASNSDREQRLAAMPDTTHRIPTAIGRTQAMFSPVKVIIAGALVFALGGLFLVAQPFEQQEVGVPAAQMTELPGVTVAATQDCDIYTDPVTCTYTASDPRVTGTLTHTYTGDIGGPATAEAELVWADATLEGPEGSWTGHLYIVWTEPTQAFAVLSGTGAYEGWQYVASGIDPEADGDHDWTGIIYEGELPPYGPLSAHDE